MVAISVGGRKVSSFQELVERLPADALASPRRSTVPLTDYWRDPQRRLDDLRRQIGCASFGSPELHFEYPVPVVAGRGKASYTDLMIIADGVAVAIEAKFTEPPYETVRTWLGPSATSNRRAVLDGWLKEIGRVAGHPVSVDSVIDLPYQLLHRTASVCCVNRERRYVVYQVFGDAPQPYYPEQLGRFASVLAADNQLGFVVLGCGFQPTETYRQLDAAWESGERGLDDRVRHALLAGRLFEFRDPVAVPIGPGT